MRVVLSIGAGAASRRLELEQDRIRIGRGPENDVVLRDTGVSRMHATIERRGDGFVLLDEGSANGTDLNGAAVSAAVPLRSGDRVSLGGVVIRFSTADRPAGTTDRTRLSTTPASRGELAGRIGSLWRRRSGGAVAIGSALVAALIWSRIAASRPASHTQSACADPIALDGQTSTRSFGNGAGDVDCASGVTFEFEPPSNARLLLLYTPSHIVSARELELQVNGTHLAWAPVSDGRAEEQALPIPRESVFPARQNLLSFVQTARSGRWSVAKVRLEMLAIAPGDERAAYIAYERGRRKLEERRIAPRNLYDACKAFTDARGQLDGIEPRPALFESVARLVRDCERDLDRECQKLAFSAQRFERYGEADKAQQTWRDVLLHFPGEDPSGCRKKAQANLVSADDADPG